MILIKPFSDQMTDVGLISELAKDYPKVFNRFKKLFVERGITRDECRDLMINWIRDKKEND